MWYLFCYPSSPFLNQQQISDPSILSPLRRLLLFLSPNNRQLGGGGLFPARSNWIEKGGGPQKEKGSLAMSA